jgi:DNA-binding winged helix-turn-helix (wHTH) protein/tetratricopeptide (TPR) repeat protein
MNSPPRPPVVIRFGVFELDAATGELRRSGVVLKLHPQPFRLLLLLAERPGQIVTREEIRRCLWGDNTFVDFERGINFCVNQIRSVVGDDAENPRCIETLPRRGYRFIAPMSNGESARHPVVPFHAPAIGADSRMPDRNGEEFASAQEMGASSSHPPSAVLNRSSRKTLGVAIIAFATIAVLIAGAIVDFHRPRKLTEKDSIVLADFSNTTGDAVFDGAPRQALAVELGQSPFLNVLSDSKASETLRMMGRPANVRVTEDLGRELCLRTGSKALLAGSISSLGSYYLVELKAVACSSGEALANEQFEATRKEDVLKAISRAASSVRAKLGESLPSVQKFDIPIEATTTSLEALKSFSTGAKVGNEQGDAPSIPFLKRAIELDPKFAIAYAALAAHYSNLDEPSLALEYATKAYELRDRVTEREKLGISFIYFRVTGEVEKQAQVFDLWMADYPRDGTPHVSLGMNFVFMGQYEKALAEFQKALQLGPGSAAVYENLSGLYLALDRLDEAKATLNQAQASKLDGAGLHWIGYYLGFLQGDIAQMEQQVAWAAGKPGTEDILLSAQSDTEAYYGRLNGARDFSRRAVDSAVRADANEAAALWRVTAALREAELGKTAKARDDVRQALALAPGRNVKIFAALTLARANDTARALALAHELEKNYPSNTVLKIYRLPTINAAIALSKGNSSQALETLEIVKPYELGAPTPSFYETLYPPYLRGEAYLLARNGSAAVAEYQKVINHRGIALNFPPGVLAHLGLARAYAMQGNTARAKSAYNDFFTLWKNADPDIPILIAAKTEYAKLK